MYFLDKFLKWIFEHPGLIVFLVIIYSILKGSYGSLLALRASSCNSIHIEGQTIDAKVLFERIKVRISGKGLTDVSFQVVNIQDGHISPYGRDYLKVRYRSFIAYISSFSFGNDGIISYWVIAPRNPWERFFNLLPFYGKVIVNILRTPTLYKADIQSATHGVVQSEIKAAIDELMTGTPKVRKTSQEFKSFIEASINRKK